MNELPFPRDGEASVPVDFSASLTRRMLVSEAALLARKGDYSGGEALLSDLLGEPDALTLDLQARIRAQQGRYHEAEALWLEASRIEPGNEAYRAALNRLATAQARPPWIRRVMTLGVALVAIVFLALLGSRITGDLSAIRQAVERDTGLPEQSGPSVVDAAPPAEASAGIASESEGAPVEGSEALSSLREALEIAGISIRQEQGALALRFESGLFREGTAMTPWGLESLDALGSALRPFGSAVMLEVVGHVDDLPLKPGTRYRDNASLGLHRAVVATDQLRSSSGLQAHLFRARAGEEALAPFPNDSPENRLRNRTVTLRVTTTHPGLPRI